LHPEAIKAKGDDLDMIWRLIDRHRYVCIYNGEKMSRSDFLGHRGLFDVMLEPSDFQ
jgi:hypothetical protein